MIRVSSQQRPIKLTISRIWALNSYIRGINSGFLIKAEKPVLGYALNTEQATGLQGSQLIPHYESYSKNIQWGLIDPSFVLEKATNSTGEFIYGDYIEYRYDDGKYVAMNKTKGEVHPLTYVVDGRWMSYDPVYENVQAFAYEITITKTGGPTEQSFNF